MSALVSRTTSTVKPAAQHFGDANSSDTAETVANLFSLYRNPMKANQQNKTRQPGIRLIVFVRHHAAAPASENAFLDLQNQYTRK